MESKEEPKQENCCTPIGQIKRYLNCVGCDQKPEQETNKTHYSDVVPNIDKDVLLKMWNEAMPKLEPKQETLEEVALRLIPYQSTAGLMDSFSGNMRVGFVRGAKWQAERMYSEEEVIAIVEKSRETGLTAEYLLLTEQFKKK
jgi:hypothetical protein